MPHFSETSKARLGTCHADLRAVFHEVIRIFDCKVIYGHRTPEEQFELFKRGRRLENDIWVIENILEVVTYKDGFDDKSNHNIIPSDAGDIAPYPINWKDINRMYFFAGHVLMIAKYHGIILRWGGDWDMDTQIKDQNFNDLVHFERIE